MSTLKFPSFPPTEKELREKKGGGGHGDGGGPTMSDIERRVERLEARLDDVIQAQASAATSLEVIKAKSDQQATTAHISKIESSLTSIVDKIESTAREINSKIESTACGTNSKIESTAHEINSKTDAKVSSSKTSIIKWMVGISFSAAGIIVAVCGIIATIACKVLGH